LNDFDRRDGRRRRRPEARGGSCDGAGHGAGAALVV